MKRPKRIKRQAKKRREKRRKRVSKVTKTSQGAASEPAPRTCGDCGRTFTPQPGPSEARAECRPPQSWFANPETLDSKLDALLKDLNQHNLYEAKPLGPGTTCGCGAVLYDTGVIFTHALKNHAHITVCTHCRAIYTASEREVIAQFQRYQTASIAEHYRAQHPDTEFGLVIEWANTYDAEEHPQIFLVLPEEGAYNLFELLEGAPFGYRVYNTKDRVECFESNGGIFWCSGDCAEDEDE